MNNIIFSSCINSDIYNVKPVVNDILTTIISVFPNISKEDKLDLKLVLSEAISNAVIHGNNKNNDKKVSIIVHRLNYETFLFEIEDEGSGFNFKSIIQEEKNQDLYNESGRGFLIIDSLCDNVEFLQNGKKINIYKTVHSSV